MLDLMELRRGHVARVEYTVEDQGPDHGRGHGPEPRMQVRVLPGSREPGMQVRVLPGSPRCAWYSRSSRAAALAGKPQEVTQANDTYDIYSLRTFLKKDF